MRKVVWTIVVLCLIVSYTYAQGNEEYTGGYKVKFNEEGSKYLRILAWGQFWVQYNDNTADNASQLNLSVRRARLLTFTQLNDKFMILTHFGLNSLNGDNMSPTGRGESSQLFFHDFWGEWKLAKNTYVGAGLHYWNGISRLNNQSTLNMMTLDNNRQAWAALGLSDQFARHLGVYFKGSLGKLQYRLSVNDALANNLQGGVVPDTNGAAVYQGRNLLGSADAGTLVQGYADFNFLDQESNFLPYKVGTYLGSKRIFNIGAGFLAHPNGSVITDADGNLQGENVFLFSVDVFYDAPIGSSSAITAYAMFQSNDYGHDFTFRTTYESGTMLYGHVGYLLPGDKDKTRFQPYLSYQNRSIDALDDTANRLGVGANIFFTGHHSKLSLEYANAGYAQTNPVNTVTVQAMIYL